MLKLTQKSIREWVKMGIAVDITTNDEPVKGKSLRQIAYSCGVYGCNGAILQDINTGDTYAITSRSTNLFQYC